MLLYLFSFAVNIVSAPVKRKCENDTSYQDFWKESVRIHATNVGSSHTVRHIQKDKEGNAVSCDTSPNMFTEENIKPI
jgi:hypothetical protein